MALHVICPTEKAQPPGPSPAVKTQIGGESAVNEPIVNATASDAMAAPMALLGVIVKPVGWVPAVGIPDMVHGAVMIRPAGRVPVVTAHEVTADPTDPDNVFVVIATF